MRETLEYININCEHVFINKDKITSFVENISNYEYNYLFSGLKKFVEDKCSN